MLIRRHISYTRFFFENLINKIEDGKILLSFLHPPTRDLYDVLIFSGVLFSSVLKSF